MNSIRRYAVALMLSLGLLLSVLPAGVARASSDDENSKVYDARLEGYQTTVTLDSGSTALTWLLLIVLAGACVAVMFMNPKRSHLD